MTPVETLLRDRHRALPLARTLFESSAVAAERLLAARTLAANEPDLPLLLARTGEPALWPAIGDAILAWRPEESARLLPWVGAVRRPDRRSWATAVAAGGASALAACFADSDDLVERTLGWVGRIVDGWEGAIPLPEAEVRGLGAALALEGVGPEAVRGALPPAVPGWWSRPGWPMRVRIGEASIQLDADPPLPVRAEPDGLYLDGGRIALRVGPHPRRPGHRAARFGPGPGVLHPMRLVED